MEGDNLILVALKEYKFISSSISSMHQIKQEEFSNAIISLIHRIGLNKGIEIKGVPNVLSKDINQKYKECHKIVELIKELGFKSSFNLNNILFPTQKDMSNLFEFLVELLSKEENVETEEMTEKKLTKIKRN